MDYSSLLAGTRNLLLMTVGYGVMCLASSAAQAQTASQITPPSYAPSIESATGAGIWVSSNGSLTAPQGAEALHITPSGLIVSGGIPAMEEETARIRASIKGKRITAAALFDAANRLEAAYAKAGYILARVTLPPQTLQDGQPLKMVVTKGFIEAVDSKALPERIRGRIDHLLAPLTGQDDVTRRAIERRLLLAGDIPGLKLKSILRPGQTPGGTVLVVEGRHDAVSATVGVDNALSDPMGTWSTNLGLTLNSLLGLGEVIYANLSGYPGLDEDTIFDDDPRNRQFAAGFTLPLGASGAWMEMEAVDSRSHSTTSAPVSWPSHYQRLASKLGYHWLRSRQANLSSILTFELAREEQDMAAGRARISNTKDELRVLRFTQAGDIFPSWGGHASARVTLSQGLDALGARKGTAALPLSRSGAKPDFTKLSIEARISQAFAHQKAEFSLDVRAQTSFGQALVSSEQMSLGGSQALSAFDSGALSGDSVIMARTEVALPQTLDWFAKEGIGAAAVPYIFAAGGIAKLENPSVFEHELTRAGALGVGVRFGLAKRANALSSNLTLEYAHGAATHQDSEDRFNIALQVGF